MSIDPRLGDIVHVRMRFISPSSKREGCYLLANRCPEWIDHVTVHPCDIVHVEPRPLKVYDFVRPVGSDNPTKGQIRFIDDDGSALIRWGRSHSGWVTSLEELERVDD